MLNNAFGWSKSDGEAMNPNVVSSSSMQTMDKVRTFILKTHIEQNIAKLKWFKFHIRNLMLGNSDAGLIVSVNLTITTNWESNLRVGVTKINICNYGQRI